MSPGVCSRPPGPSPQTGGITQRDESRMKKNANQSGACRTHYAWDTVHDAFCSSHYSLHLLLLQGVDTKIIKCAFTTFHNREL